MKKWCFFVAFLMPCLLQGQTISTVAGNGASVFSGEGVPAITAKTPNPHGGAFDRHGNYYFCDGQNSNRIRKITPAGIITTVAGNGSGGFSGDGGPATSAQLNGPGGVAVDTLGNLYIADLQNQRIRKVTAATGIISTFAGTGIGTYNGDGIPAATASIWGPQDVCIDKYGNVYIADAFNYRVRKVAPDGIISTYAGNGTPGYSGEGTTATSSMVGLLVGLCSDTSGNIYTASNTICRVMKISTAGIMTTVAGNGGTTYIGDGIPATTAQIIPGRVFVDIDNNLFITDKNNCRVYKVDATGILYNIIGNGTPGDTGDGGLATAATLNYPVGIVADVCGNLYVPTVGSLSVPGSGRRIRKVTFNPSTTAAVTITGITSAALGATVTVNAAVSGAGSSYSIKWFNKGVQFATTATPVVTFTKVHNRDSITARIVPAITYCYDSAMSNLHIVTKSSVGVEPLLEASPVCVYPNPAYNQLTVTGSNITAITISNPLGQALITTAQTDVDVSVLPAGIYSIKVMQLGGYSTVQKFIKN
ncbi:MAG: T9SS type A sorting domain-containing protein [Bacteroidota bacterium]